jgi:hypothetical protein
MTATRNGEALASSGTHAVTRVLHFPKSRHWRVDAIGALAVAVAAAGLVSTVVFLRPGPTAVPHTASAPPTRDQWYLDARLPGAGRSAAGASSVVADRWWEDTEEVRIAPKIAEPPIRDQWYLDAAARTTNPERATPQRDRWYLDNP